MADMEVQTVGGMKVVISFEDGGSDRETSIFTEGEEEIERDKGAHEAVSSTSGLPIPIPKRNGTMNHTGGSPKAGRGRMRDSSAHSHRSQSNGSDPSSLDIDTILQTPEEVMSESVDKFVSCIMPNNEANAKRQQIITFLSTLIKSAFPSRCGIIVIPFGSVPLRAYLPTGDIDIGIFCRGYQLSNSWAYILQSALKDAGSRKPSETETSVHRITGIHVIDAEVRVCKCFVDGIEVDISANMPGGVSTLAFLERVRLLREPEGSHFFMKSTSSQTH